MFESDLEENIFRRRLMKEVAAGVPVHFSFYSPRVKVQVQDNAEHLLGANGRYIGDGGKYCLRDPTQTLGSNSNILTGLNFCFAASRSCSLRPLPTPFAGNPPRTVSSLADRVGEQLLFAQHDGLEGLAGPHPLGLGSDEREGVGFGE